MIASSDRTRIQKRVERLFAIAAPLRDQDGPDRRELDAKLVRTTGLSPQGVRLAFSAHLERPPIPFDKLLTSVSQAPQCHVLLSSNVCIGALRALAVALATGGRVWVRPSRRDPLLAVYLADRLSSDEAFRQCGGSVTTVDVLSPSSGDAAHLYGADETLAQVVQSFPPGVLVRAFGSGFGIAVLDDGASVDEAAERMAQDVVAFDQQGCLSPRLTLVADRDCAGRFAQALHGALERWGTRVPRGALERNTLAAIARYEATARAVGTLFRGTHHAVGLSEEAHVLLPPPTRIVHVVWCPAPLAVGLLESVTEKITAVGCEGSGALQRTLAKRLPNARWSRFGEMQRPPLDGPVDGRIRPTPGRPRGG